MSETTTLTIRIQRETRDQLDKIARGARRSKSFIAAELLTSFVQDQAWYEAKIAAARQSRLLSTAEVSQMFRELEGIDSPLAGKRKTRSARNR